MLKKITLLINALFLVILFWQSVGAELNIIKLTSTINDQEDITITIYNSNLGLVKDMRTLSLPVRQVELNFVDIASRIDPTSVHFKSLTDHNGVDILEQNYQFDLITPKRLMDSYVGKTVTLIEQAKGDNEETMVEAKLISTGDGYVYQVGDRIHLGHPGRVVLKKIPEDFNVTPTLTWLLENRQENEQMVEVSYLTGGINWKSNYVVVVDEKDEKIDLTGWVTITNKSGVTYRNASLKLVAGEIHRVESSRFYENYTAKAMKAEQEPRFAEKPFFEYHLYNLIRPTTIKNNQIKQMTLFAANAVVFKKFFTFEGMPRFYWHRHSKKSTGKVMVKLEVVNSKDNNLGIPLPEGRIKIYKNDSDGSLQFIGEDKIMHTPKGERILLTAGSSSDIVGEHIQTSFEKLDKDTIQESFEIKIKNHKKEDIAVKVIEHLAGDWKITQSSQQWIKKNVDTIEFLLEVPVDGEKSITYTIAVRR